MGNFGLYCACVFYLIVCVNCLVRPVTDGIKDNENVTESYLELTFLPNYLNKVPSLIAQLSGDYEIIWFGITHTDKEISLCVLASNKENNRCFPGTSINSNTGDLYVTSNKRKDFKYIKANIIINFSQHHLAYKVNNYDAFDVKFEIKCGSPIFCSPGSTEMPTNITITEQNMYVTCNIQSYNFVYNMTYRYYCDIDNKTKIYKIVFIFIFILVCAFACALIFMLDFIGGLSVIMSKIKK